MDELSAQIRHLELKLLHTDMRENPVLLDALLSEDFEEIGHDGQVHSRQAVVEWLQKKDPQLKWSLEDFRIRMLSNDLVMAIYRAVRISPLPEKNGEMKRGSIRNSIWQRQKGCWRMIFHQATKQQ